MYCKSCGKELKVDDNVCSNCGTPIVKESNPAMVSVEPVSMPVEQPQMVDIPNMSSVSTMPVGQPQMVDIPNMSSGSTMPVVTDNLNQNMGMNPNMNMNQNMGMNPNMNMNQNMGMNPNMNMNQNMGMNQNVNNSHSKNKLFVIIVAVLGFIVVALVVLLVVKNLPAASKNNSTEKVDDSNVVALENTYNYEGFDFLLPQNYEASIEDGYLVLLNHKDKVAIYATILNGYTVEDALDELGDTIDYNQKKVSNVSWITRKYVENDVTTGQTIDCMKALASFGSSRILCFDMASLGSDFDTVLKNLSAMINGTSFKGSTTFAASTEKDTFDFSLTNNSKIKYSIFN